MQEKISKGFRERFLLMLTKELVMNTDTYKGLKTGEEVKEFIVEEKGGQGSVEGAEKKEMGEFIKERIKKESDKISEMGRTDLLPELNRTSRSTRGFTRMVPSIKRIPPVLRIPEPALPETVSYIRPVPTPKELDLLKLNILVRDSLVRIIECNGPDENIIVMGGMGRKPTSTKLSKEEIDTTIGRFAEASKIPLHEGLFKAAVGSLIISAVISEVAGKKFIIRKILPRI